MCDDFIDDDFDGECENDGIMDDDFKDIEADGDGEITFELDNGSWGFPNARDWGIIGPISEEIARENQEQERLYRKMEDEWERKYDV